MFLLKDITRDCIQRGKMVVMSGLKRLGLVLMTCLIMASLAITVNFCLDSGADEGKARGREAIRDYQAVDIGEKISRMSKEEMDLSKEEIVRLPLSEINDTETLILIGPTYAAVDKEPALTLLEDGLLCREDVRPALMALLTEAKANGITLQINSAYRTESEQAELYDEIRDKSLVQPPGHSEHQTGLALDIQPITATKDSSGDAFEVGISFLAEYAGSFGFIQRYPEDKEGITGIGHEFWHYRYVGEPHAGFMADQGLTLEEYLDLLAYQGHLEIEGEQDSYRIYWKKPQDGEIQFYPGEDYEISSTNTGAYIVTVKGKTKE